MDYSYVDTSAWVALADSAEASHDRVAAALRDRPGCRVTSDHVLHETWTVMTETVKHPSVVRGVEHVAQAPNSVPGFRVRP